MLSHCNIHLFKASPIRKIHAPPPCIIERKGLLQSSVWVVRRFKRYVRVVVFTDSGLVLVQRGWLQVRTTVAVWEPRPWPLATLCLPSVTPTATFTSTPRSPSLPMFLSKWVQGFDVFRSSSSWTFALFHICCTISAWISESSYII